MVMKKLSPNKNAEAVKNFVAAANAVAEQQLKSGQRTEFISAENALSMYTKLLRLAAGYITPGAASQRAAEELMRDATATARNAFAEIGTRVRGEAEQIASKLQNVVGDPVEAAFNAIAGNPTFDHFANLNLLAAQLTQETSFVDTFISMGDTVNIPIEAGGTGLDKQRFRVPVEKVSGSPKVAQGDIAPAGYMRDDANRLEISLYNEFKNAYMNEQVFTITQAMRDQALGYQSALAPALAGFILQQRYFSTAQRELMRMAEVVFTDGQHANAGYSIEQGGGYGLLSSSIQLLLPDASSPAPNVASANDWRSNPTRLLQVITNSNYLIPSVTQPIPANADPVQIYRDIVRLINLLAIQHVNYRAQSVVLYVPTSWYALAVQYPAGGTFNKQLNELVTTATAGVVTSVRIVPSALLNYRPASIHGDTGSAYNWMIAVFQGCDTETKPVIMPALTTSPVVTTDSVTPTLMNFRIQYLFGGPMFTHLGGAVAMRFSQT